MVQRKGGLKRKTRGKFSKNIRRKGKISLKQYFQELNDGQKVALTAEPAVNKGTYNKRFYGKTGIVVGKQGECYMVEVRDGKTQKKVIVHPSHIKAL